jgi:hypothetical protein
VNEKEPQISELFVYKEKQRGLDISQSKRLEEEKCKYKKYSTLFWFMLVLYVCSLDTIFHCRCAVLN